MCVHDGTDYWGNRSENAAGIRPLIAIAVTIIHKKDGPLYFIGIRMAEFPNES